MFNEFAPPFPGEEFTTVIPSSFFNEYLYEENRILYGHTTDGETVVLPYTEYWTRSVSRDGMHDEVGRARWTVDAGMTENELDALNRARVLQRIREQDGNPSPSFSSLRELSTDASGLLLLNVTDNSQIIGTKFPYAAVGHLETVCDIDYVVPVRGPGVASMGDMLEFAPPEAAEKANVYYYTSEVRTYNGELDNRGYYCVRVRLCHAEADLDYPLPSAE